MHLYKYTKIKDLDSREITSLPQRTKNKMNMAHHFSQCAKKVVSNSLGLVDFAIGLINSLLNLPDGQMKFFEGFKLQKWEINLLIKTFLGLVVMMFGLVTVNFSLPEW